MTSSALGNASLFSVSHQKREPSSFQDTAQTPQVLVPSGPGGALAWYKHCNLWQPGCLFNCLEGLHNKQLHKEMPNPFVKKMPVHGYSFHMVIFSHEVVKHWTGHKPCANVKLGYRCTLLFEGCTEKLHWETTHLPSCSSTGPHFLPNPSKRLSEKNAVALVLWSR